jgi:hypothetical protein
VNPNTNKLIILKYLQQFESGQIRIEQDLHDIKIRLSTLENRQRFVIQHIQNLSSSIALKTNPLPL